jgi:hypothetical protein
MQQHSSTTTVYTSRDLDMLYDALRSIEDSIEFIVDEHEDRNVNGAYPHEAVVRDRMLSIKLQARVIFDQLLIVLRTLRALP